MTLDSNTSFTCSADSGVDTANEKVNKKNLNKIKKCLDNCLWQEKGKIFFLPFLMSVIYFLLLIV